MNIGKLIQQIIKKDVTFDEQYDSGIFDCDEHPHQLDDSIEEKAIKYMMDPK